MRANLHVVLCMSPVGEPFRNRIRQYPAFVNCMTIDWFSEWPEDALLEVAEKYLEGKVTLLIVISVKLKLFYFGTCALTIYLLSCYMKICSVLC